MRYVIWVAVGMLGVGCGRSPFNPYYAETTGQASGTTGVATSSSASSVTGTTGTHSTGTTGTQTTGATGTTGTATGGTSGTTGSSGAACTSSNDCPSLITACSASNVCQSVACSPTPSAGGGGGVGAPCLMADGTEGSCLLSVAANGFFCTLPGTDSSTCSTSATRADLASACATGLACGIGPDSNGGPACAEECDPAVGPTDGCNGSDMICLTSQVDARIGYCELSVGVTATNGTGGTPGTSSTTGSAGTGTGTGGGTTGGASSTTSGSTGGMCLPEFTPCTAGGAPSCCNNMDCVFEPLRGGDVCEVACTMTSECPTAFTVCTGTTCTLNLCGEGIGGPPNGTLDGTCNAEGTNDGTCIPGPGFDGGGFGLCYQGGSATGMGCSVNPSRNNLGGLCEAGDFCGPSIMGGIGTQCYLLCNPSDPNAGTHCQSGGFTSCNKVPGDPGLGFCL